VWVYPQGYAEVMEKISTPASGHRLQKGKSGSEGQKMVRDCIHYI
jgi:hypothetical protein